MPTVRYGPPKVDTAPLPGVRKQAAETAGSTGADYHRTEAAAWGNIAQTGLGVASTFDQLAKEERARADDTALLKAETQLGQAENNYLYNPDTGALGRKGEAAMPLPEESTAWFTKTASDIAGGLSTDRQRAMFAKVQENHALNLDGTVRRHVFGEMQNFEKTELQSYVETSVSSAVANASDPRRVGVELQNITDAIHKHAARIGLGPAGEKRAIADAQTDVHVGVIGQLLADGKDKAAQVYFEETKSQINGEKIAHIEAALEEGATRGESQRQADTITGAGGTLTEQLAKVRAIEDPKLRDAVRERVEHESAISDRAKREQEEAASVQAFNIVDKSKDVRSIPPAMWAAFTGNTKESLRSYARQLAKGDPVETDLPTYYALIRQAGDSPTTFVGQNMLDYKSKLGETEFKQMAEMQLALRRGEQPKELPGFRTKQELVDNTLTQYGIDPKDDAMKPAVAQLQRMLDLRVDAAQQSGQKVTNVEIQKALDDLLSQKETVPGSWWALVRPFTYDLADKSKMLLQTTPGDIPQNERTLIEASLRKAGRPISDATVLNIYLEHKLRNAQ